MRILAFFLQAMVWSSGRSSQLFSVDHTDAIIESAEASDWWLQGLDLEEKNETLRNALRLRAPTRSELALRLAKVLDEVEDSSKTYRRLEARFVDTLARLARDTLIEVSSKKLNNAAKARPKQGGQVDDLSLHKIGRLQAMLGKRAQPTSLILQSARLLECEDAIDALVSNQDTNLHLSIPQDKAFDSVFNRTALTQIMTASAIAIKNRRLDDGDAKQLRRSIRRRRIISALTSLLIARSGYWLKTVVERAGGFRLVTRKVFTIISTTTNRRIVNPVLSLLDDLLLNHRRSQIGDPRAVAQAELTLQRMLRDFHHDIRIDQVSSEKGDAMAQDLDMSGVHAVMVKEIRHAVRNILSGHVARAMLVQIQFVQLQLARSIAAIDSLLGANQALISVLALLPSITCAYFFFRGLRSIVIATVSESYQTTAKVHSELAAAFSELARLVFLADQTKPLDDTTLGAITILNSQLIRRLQQEKARFHPAKLARLLRGLRDIVSFPPHGQQPRTANQIAHLLNHLLWDFDFLRLDQAYSTPPPLELLAVASPPGL